MSIDQDNIGLHPINELDPGLQGDEEMKDSGSKESQAELSEFRNVSLSV